MVQIEAGVGFLDPFEVRATNVTPLGPSIRRGTGDARKSSDLGVAAQVLNEPSNVQLHGYTHPCYAFGVAGV